MWKVCRLHSHGRQVEARVEPVLPVPRTADLSLSASLEQNFKCFWIVHRHTSNTLARHFFMDCKCGTVRQVFRCVFMSLLCEALGIGRVALLVYHLNPDN